jgi:outer membrane lipoprotein-sorting protein
MKNMKVGFILFGVFLYSGIHAASAEDVSNIQEALSSGKECSATWSSESSKVGQKTIIFNVRKLNGEIQYQVYHSSERPRIWTWDFRIEKIKCK